jgi:parvulin-like peptidyl-prolyl isomerase
MANAQGIKESGIARFPFFFFIIPLLFISSCGDNQQSDKVVARVDDQVLTMKMIKSEVDPSRILNESELQQFVNRWITNELLYQEARRRGYDESEEIERKVNEARKQLSVAELLEREVYSLAENSVQSSEIAKYFQEHSDEYVLKETMVKLSVAIFNQSEIANQFRSSALGPNGWDQSVDEFRRGGSPSMISYSDSLYFTQSSLYPPELWKVATVLGIDEVSFPIKTSVGFVVLRSLGQFKKGSLTPLDAVSDEIRRRLAMERRQELYQKFIQQLRNKHSVQFLVSAVDSVALGGE